MWETRSVVDLLLAEGGAGGDRSMESAVQHGTAPFVTGLQAPGTRSPHSIRVSRGMSGHQSPQTTVLLLQLLHPPCLFQLQSAVFLAPAIIGLFSYARFSAGLPGGLVVGYFDFDLPQDRDDLLSTMFFPRHAPASSRTSFSNISPGTKFAGQVRGSRLPAHQQSDVATNVPE